MSTSQVPKSKWGSLLSGAVAGLESRLDNILAEEGSAAAKNAEFERRRDEAKKPNTHVSQHVPSPSRYSQKQAESQRTRDFAAGAAISSPTPDSHNDKGSGEETLKLTGEAGSFQDPSQQAEASANLSLESFDLSTTHPDLAAPIHASDVSQRIAIPAEIQHEGRLEPPQADFADSETESSQEDELQRHLERIDALQAKLQYLANDAANVARLSISKSEEGTWQKKLAAKDEQIALLLEEGTKLSKTEVAQASIIKRLRIKVNEDAKAQSEARRALVEAERSQAKLQDRLVRLEDEKRDAHSKLIRFSRLEKELGDARREKGIKEATIHDLQGQLNAKRKQADENTRSGSEKAFEHEKHLSQSLRDELSKAKSDQKLSEVKSKAEIKDIRDEQQREKERHRTDELSFQNEIANLETRIELMRERSEEASSAATNDSHAKLLRQVDTLQSQYAVASENWQVLETSLQARLTLIEGEKVEACRREAEARKRARETGIALRRLQDQLDDAKQKFQTAEHELQEQRNVTAEQKVRTNTVEKLLLEEKERFQAARDAWDATLQSKVEEEKAKWQLGSSKAVGDYQAILASPRESGQRKTSYMEIPGLVSRRQSSRQVSELSLTGTERPASRRTSTFLSKISATSPNGFDSEKSIPAFDSTQHATASPTRTVDEHEHENSSSRYRPVNDMLSGATTSAGPSVQLVERMSAAVRRLETEKAASRDELARLSSQRDEARKEVVDLMREVEQARALQTKADTLEKGLAEVSQRYTTTLEMLGERSERVQELEADVADIKKIYRELVEATLT